MSLLDIKKAHKKDVCNLLKNEEIAVVGPSDKPASMLRVYSHGGLIGRLAVGNHGDSHLLDKSYYLDENGENKTTYLSEKESADLLAITNNSEKTGTQKLLSEEYLKLAIEASKNKGKKQTDSEDMSVRERDIQTKIVRKYMSGDKWIVVDMEFSPSDAWNIGKGKPDLIVYDFDRKELGIIELKYNNENANNLGKHYEDFMNVYNNPIPFNREIARRVINYMVPCGLINEEVGEKIREGIGTVEKPKSTKVWFGFLFIVNPLEVENGLKGAKNLVKDYLKGEDGNIITPIDECRFLYRESIDSLSEKGLCYEDMYSYEDFKRHTVDEE